MSFIKPVSSKLLASWRFFRKLKKGKAITTFATLFFFSSNMPAEDLFTCGTVLVCLDVPLVFCGGDQLMCSFENAGSETLGSPFHSSSRFFLWRPTSCLPLCVKDEIPPLKDVLELSASHFKAHVQCSDDSWMNILCPRIFLCFFAVSLNRSR